MDEDIIFITKNGKIIPIKADSLYSESKRWAETLTSKEIHAIRKYTKNSLETGKEKNKNKFYAELNEYLRLKQIGIGLYDKFYEDYSYIISNGINKFNLKENIVCFRGSNHDETNDTPIGKTYNYASFYSTSIDEDMAFDKKYEYTIYVPKGARCAFVHSISRFKYQKELLIDKDTKFKVKSKDGYKIELEIVL